MSSGDGFIKQNLTRRGFLETGAAALAGSALGLAACGRGKPAPQPLTGAVPAGTGYDYWNTVFETVTAGFIRAARATSDTFAVCDYPGGTYLKNFIAASGRTCDSVTRMLPALAARVAAPDSGTALVVDGESYDLAELLVKALANATDPECKDFWQYPGTDGWNQRQVESSIVAWSLWLARDKIMGRFTPAQRTNLQNWLASCTKVPTRTNNWALFTAVNQAARIALSERWSEFSGDPDWMLADLAAIDSMYRGDGWYSDSTDGEAYDYYNFWVFASHTLYWDALVGERYPELRQKYRERLQAFLAATPFFFGGNGSHVLMGRSLIYRWATLTPLTLAHGLGQWPLSTGLLRRVCNRNLAFLWEAGAWDPENGKLRETLTLQSNHDICESYINLGHPYWGMQAFYAMSFGRDDPFWSAAEEPLPVEAGDFTKVIQAPGLLLSGVKAGGQTRLWQARCTQHYPNKYYNFSWSSHFPWNVGMVGDKVAPDCMLTFRDTNGAYGRRDSDYTGELVSDHTLHWKWTTRAGKSTIDVESFLLVDGELEWRAHKVDFSGGRELTAAGHTLALGLEKDEEPLVKSGGVWEWSANARGEVVFVRSVLGFTEQESLTGFEGRDDLNSFYPRARQAAVSVLLQPGKGQTILVAAFYASPKPEPLEVLLKRSVAIPQEVADFAGLET